MEVVRVEGHPVAFERLKLGIDRAEEEIDRNDAPSGYMMAGKVFAFGYMKGIMDALKLPYL